jgi:leader peptidase (prepilin peptidase)/N-methyltransferase
VTGAPSLEWVFGIWAAVSGAVVGSFLNVVIARLPEGQSIVHPRSRCPRCGAPIAWYDNVPVLSWVLLRASCRACHGRISARYPFVEALCGAAGWLAFHRHGMGIAALFEFLFVAGLVALAFIDLDTWTIPHVLSWPLMALGLGAAVAGVGAAGGFVASALGLGIGLGTLAAFALASTAVFRRTGRIGPDEEAMGFGDVFLLGAIGAYLGAWGLLPVLFLASIQGTVVGVAQVLAGRATRGPRDGGAPAPDGFVPPRHALPFGPFLALGAVEWLYLGGALAAGVPALSVFSWG